MKQNLAKNFLAPRILSDVKGHPFIMSSICSAENLALQIDNSDYNSIKYSTKKFFIFSNSLLKSLHVKINPYLTVEKNTKISRQKYRNSYS